MNPIPPDISPEEWEQIPPSVREKLLQQQQTAAPDPVPLRTITPLLPVLRRVDRAVAWGTAQAERAQRALPRVSAALARFHILIELTLVVLIGVFAAREYAGGDATRRYPGREAEWLTSSAYMAHEGLMTGGAIPLWQPYLNWGEPVVENPFAFVFNPLSMFPSLLLGPLEGLKVSIILYAVFAGLGGWVLARVLRLTWPARMLLALLLMGKGSMVGMIGTGYYQLGVSQAYIGWVIAGAIVALRDGRRWGVALTAISFTLMLWAGNVWYTLPTLLAVGFLTLLYTFGNDSTDWGAFRRMALAGVFTLALSAAVFVPLWTQQGYIGRHPNERGAGVVVDFWNMTRQYFDGDPARYAQRTAPGQVEFYHAFVIPLWFAALTVWLALTLRPLRKLNDSDPAPDAARWIIPVGLVMLVIATVWAAGGNPFFVWLYQTVPLLGQWRFVGRALAVGGFWLAVLVALYYDEAWRTATSRTWATLHPQLASVRWNMAAALLVAGAAAAYPVVAQWEPYSGTERISTFEPTCLDWLRARYPDEPLTVYVVGYDVVTPYLERRIRLHEIEADYRAEPVSATLGAFDLRTALPAFGMARTQQDRDRLAALGYTVITDSPAVDGTNPCLYALNTPTLPYTFTTTLTAIQATPANDLLIAEQTQEAALIERRFDRVRVQATGTPDAVLIVQETAYPGWHVSVDGQPARLEAVGSMVGVQLPDDGQPHEVVFEYRPALLHISLWITLLAALALALYLAGADRAAPPIRALVQRRRGAVAE